MIELTAEQTTATEELTLEALVQNMRAVLDFVSGKLEQYDCSPVARMTVETAVEELFLNIANYAYSPGTGAVTVRVETVREPLSIAITFMDGGVPYNPLAMEDPDPDLIAENRSIGGFGIFMVKSTMDAVTYEYKNGRNVLMIRKNLNDTLERWTEGDTEPADEALADEG